MEATDYYKSSNFVSMLPFIKCAVKVGFHFPTSKYDKLNPWVYNSTLTKTFKKYFTVLLNVLFSKFHKFINYFSCILRRESWESGNKVFIHDSSVFDNNPLEGRQIRVWQLLKFGQPAPCTVFTWRLKKGGTLLGRARFLPVILFSYFSSQYFLSLCTIILHVFPHKWIFWNWLNDNMGALKIRVNVFGVCFENF